MTDTKNMMQSMASALDDVLNEKGKPKKNGFVLLVFPFDGAEGQRTNYVSNGQRQDIVVALKEIIARFEGQPQQSGRA
ncbi:hypothetical protein C8J36_103568 [Rhizobium sp. PP-F2F-G48]|uniref:hypothetical protein n=1 Tax=Rhizobium sp. PP-F2F-G48 TaxID=2135651 RepID=UPI00104463BA|nr:hypothetical protein [Rhizobium sp. PP-F2F-G48]TCM56196.1 hypothetical protein C8J36_103568 [Rhizobium sp. PP-F2F-G48]